MANEASEALNLNWKSPGPVCTSFMHCSNDVEMLNGPIGAGKTRTVFVKAIRRARQQQPSSVDGIRKFKLCVVHANYRQLWRSTLESWFKLMPRSTGDFIGTKDGPATHTITFRPADGILVDFRVDFLAIGENAAEDVMRGYEPTAFYLNECDLLAEDVYTFARGRAGRYPDMAEGGPTWYGILADCNAPQLSSWLYKKVFKQRSAGVSLFRQPSALSPNAENLRNLPAGYYAKQIEDQDESYVARMVENKPGYSSDGQAIYRKDFVDDDSSRSNVSRNPLRYDSRLNLYIGVDPRTHPSIVFGQRMPSGQWRILRELVCEKGTGPIRVGELLAQTLKEHYFEALPEQIRAWCDPSATYGADKEAGEQTWLEICEFHAGIRILPCETNAWDARYEAVRVPMAKSIDKHPALLFDPDNCPTLREGANSGYRRKKLPNGQFSDDPEKNEYADVHDALQYLMLGGGEDSDIRGRRQVEQARAGAPRPVEDHDWDPLARP